MLSYLHIFYCCCCINECDLLRGFGTAGAGVGVAVRTSAKTWRSTRMTAIRFTRLATTSVNMPAHHLRGSKYIRPTLSTFEGEDQRHIMRYIYSPYPIHSNVFPKRPCPYPIPTFSRILLRTPLCLHHIVTKSHSCRSVRGSSRLRLLSLRHLR